LQLDISISSIKTKSLRNLENVTKIFFIEAKKYFSSFSWLLTSVFMWVSRKILIFEELCDVKRNSEVHKLTVPRISTVNFSIWRYKFNRKILV
jgi:hypothetical protein